MPTTFTCIIVDSDTEAIQLLTDNLRLLYNKIAITGSYTSWEAAMNALTTEQCDLLFLDISMPAKDGIDLSTILPDIDSEVIFVTAHTKYALTAFKFSPSGFILKPVDDKELTTAVDRAVERINNKKIARQNIPASIGTKIGIPNKKGVDYISLDDIIYLEAINTHTKVVTKNAEIASNYSISKFKTLLENHHFFPVHRSYIVNMNFITRYSATGSVIMGGGIEIPVSKNTREEFLARFEKLTGTKA